MMGTRGPVPKRNEARQRRNKDAQLQEVSVIAASACAQPPAGYGWSDTAHMIWDAMASSGQAMFYQPSDWAVGFLVCNTVTAFEDSGCSNGQMMSSILSGCSSLLLTEADRRRVGIQLVSNSEDAGDKDKEVAHKWASRFSA